MQRTRLDNFLTLISRCLFDFLIGPWRRRSLGLISLLTGFYLGSNLTVYYLVKTGQRPLVVILMLFIIEILIRLRSSINTNKWPVYMVAIDNLRIGIIYAVVLEAFKLGS